MINNFDLEDIVNRIKEEELRKFLYDSLLNNDNLLNKFRVEFSDYFPKLSKEKYKNKIHSTIAKCYDGHGFIDYYNTSCYEHAMYEFTEEARKLVDNGDYETAFIIATIILDSIPDTAIDDSDGSTGMIADDCIDIIYDILVEANDKSSDILKNIYEYVIKDVKTAYLYNYGIDLKEILKYFIEHSLFLDDIEVSLENALELSKDKSYFYARACYIDYLIQIYELKSENNKIVDILEKHSYDSKICLRYVDELIKNGKLDDAIRVLKSNLDEDNWESRKYAEKLADVYLNNKMINEYKEILYDLFYKYLKYDINVYRKLKALYSNEEWKVEKNIIINHLKKDTKLNDRYLNEIYIEEKMDDELFLNVCNCRMEDVITYEKYLIPKYNKELLDIYKESCLVSAEHAHDRKRYKDLAIGINHIVRMDDSKKIVKSILEEISEKYFRNRPAMLDEFEHIVINFKDYIS